MTPVVKTAQEFMRRKLITLREQTRVIDGVASLLKENISGAPVTDDDGRYLGVFSEKCCMNALTDAVEGASDGGVREETARDFMTAHLITLLPDIDVFEAIDHILSKRISGAPVLDESGDFCGVFSEKTAMQVLISAAYDQLPGTHVAAYMNTDRARIIAKNDSLLDVAHRFQQTSYRRLPVLEGQKLIGQVSRRDVLRAEHRLVKAHVDRPRQDADVHSFSATVVADYMDCDARTITPTADLLSIAQLFLTTPYRRLPVVDDGKLVGQISRRDLLDAAAELLRPRTESHNSETLYLSMLSDERPPSIG